MRRRKLRKNIATALAKRRAREQRHERGAASVGTVEAAGQALAPWKRRDERRRGTDGGAGKRSAVVAGGSDATVGVGGGATGQPKERTGEEEVRSAEGTATAASLYTFEISPRRYETAREPMMAFWNPADATVL